MTLSCIFFQKQELLCYKFQEQPDSGSSTDRLFQMVWRRSFKSPVLSITYSDLTGDGLKELAILTLKGLHIMQVFDDRSTQTPHVLVSILNPCFVETHRREVCRCKIHAILWQCRVYGLWLRLSWKVQGLSPIIHSRPVPLSKITSG